MIYVLISVKEENKNLNMDNRRGCYAFEKEARVV